MALLPLEFVLAVGLVLGLASLYALVPGPGGRSDSQLLTLTLLYVAVAMGWYGLYATPLTTDGRHSDPDAGGWFALSFLAYLPHLAMVALLLGTACLVLIPRLLKRRASPRALAVLVPCVALTGAVTAFLARDSGVDLLHPESPPWLMWSVLPYGLAALVPVVACVWTETRAPVSHHLRT